MGKEYEVYGEHIVVRTAMPLLELLQLEICTSENKHNSLKMRATVRERDQQAVLDTDWMDGKITVMERLDAVRELFCGVIEHVVCRKENRLLIVELTAKGRSVCLDREKKKRAFQNPQKTYRQIIEEVLKDYDHINFLWDGMEDREIVDPVIQYEETDWEFLIRLGSHFSRTLFTDVRVGEQCLFFHLKDGRDREAGKAEFIGQGFDAAYYENGAYENGIARSKLFYLEMRTKEHWNIGDFILYENQRYQIYRRSMAFLNGEIIFSYRMGREAVCYQKKLYNEALAGVRIEGTVKQTEEEHVYIQLDIDDDDQEGQNYPWIWAPETNNLCYCMPEVGTKVTLYFPTQKERDGQAILAAVHRTNREIYGDVQNREFVTARRKKLGLYPQKLFLESAEGSLGLSMDDLAGIQMDSSKNISMTAGGKVCMEGNNISVTAPLEIACRTPEANLEICRDFNFYAPGGVRTVGNGDASGKQTKLPAENPNNGGRTEHWRASFSAMAAVPAADFGKIGEGTDQAVDIFACGSVPKVAGGATVLALGEVMRGRKESESSYPKVFQEMENYTVKGGHPAVKEKSKEGEIL